MSLSSDVNMTIIVVMIEVEVEVEVEVVVEVVDIVTTILTIDIISFRQTCLFNECFSCLKFSVFFSHFFFPMQSFVTDNCSVVRTFEEVIIHSRDDT